MTEPYDPVGLWSKSRLFINRALDLSNREFEERAFWACASLELLGKTALAQVSPLLIAVPTDDGKSLLAASGLDDTQGFATVPAKAVWSRCARAFKPFSEAEAKKLSLGRNSYVHSGAIGFDAIPERAWWPPFWAQAVILLSHLGRRVVDYVGPGEVAGVEAHLATQRDIVARRLEAALSRAKGQKAQAAAGTLSASQTSSWQRYVPPRPVWSVDVLCPACGSTARQGGDHVLDSAVHYAYDEDAGVDLTEVTLTVATDQVVCSDCHLDLDELDLITEAGFSDTFEVGGDLDDVDYEPEYNNE